jgi:hypothetical protein
VRQFEIKYEDPVTTANLGKFVLANRDVQNLLTINDAGTTELYGTSMTIGKPNLNQSMIFLGRTRAWRMMKGMLSDESMFELTDPLNRPRMRAHLRDGVSFFFKCLHPRRDPHG